MLEKKSRITSALFRQFHLHCFCVAALFLISSSNVVFGCPKYKDPVFYELKQKYDNEINIEKYYTGIDTSNETCLMQKFGEKGRIVLGELSDVDFCKGVLFMRLALIRNFVENRGTVLFEPNERWVLSFLRIHYGDSYFYISALEGEPYARYKIAQKMIKNLNEGFENVMPDRIEYYVSTINRYLEDAQKLSELRIEAQKLQAKVKLLFGQSSMPPHINTHPRTVICDPVFN